MSFAVQNMLVGMALVWVCQVQAGGEKPKAINLALAATPVTSFVSGHESLIAINDGFDPDGENDHRHGAYGNWPQRGRQWVQYEWSQPISTNRIDVYWWRDGEGVRLPVACRLLYWDGSAFVPAKDASGLGLAAGRYNTTSFTELTTSKLRLEFDSEGTFSTGILEWKVYDTGKSPKFAPRVNAGGDREVVLPGKTYLNGSVTGGASEGIWSKESGPGEVTFEKADALSTSAAFSAAGEYVLKLTAGSELKSSTTVKVSATAWPAGDHLQTVYTKRYAINSPLWSSRSKQLIVNWIPHCIAKLSEPKLKEGGLDNFIEAGKKNAGQPHQPHLGPPWANAYLLNTVESICVALAVDAQGDAETLAAQEAMRGTLEKWIPILLATQEPDGYFQTRFTLGTHGEQKQSPPRWTYRADHEGYVAGYFIEAAISHYLLTDGHDRRLYDAAKRLADCWDRNIGPAPKKTWYDGHQELEQALVRLGRLVNEVDGAGQGDKYVALAKFLLDSRGGGDEYDQSHVPVVRQYHAAGHAVRAMYTYSAMADIAMETGDVDYRSAVRSIWSNLVNRKYYVTGGVGSGETSEGFGGDYSLGHNAYCESCSSCGLIFFQHKMNLSQRDARFADLLEETLYNALLGSVDLPAKNFTYTNALDSSSARYAWHGCPCCVGNIPRTLLMLPEWMYAKGADGLYVNLYIGSTVKIDRVAGTDVQMVQATDYPWSGKVSITVNPAAEKQFAVRLRIPHRTTSELYCNTPDSNGITSLAINGQAISPTVENGYAVISRSWKAGDQIELLLPLPVQRVKASDKIAATRGRVALRFGPLVYNLESVDQNVEGVLKLDAPLTTRWDSDLLGGVMVIEGTFADGSKLKAVPHYARLNRGGRSIVWIKDQ